MAQTIYDNHGRPITYVRLAITDRCNLRCFYCMPAEGITYVSRKHLLSYEELLRLMNILAGLGITKVRITGGEPFLRKDLLSFLTALKAIPGIEQINLTTNGVLTRPHVPALKPLLSSVNLSLDTLDRERFKEITRRDELAKVLDCLEELIAHEIPTKINAVVMDGKNIEDIHALAELTRTRAIGVRFIEEMPFNGTGEHHEVLHWNHQQILDELKSHYPDLHPIPHGPHSTSVNYQIPGFAGNLGIIAAFSRTFCGSCNRIRITPNGLLKTCLYDDGVFQLRDFIRTEVGDDAIRDAFLNAFGNRAKNGFEAEQQRSKHRPASESMSTIGG
ncbi:MAG: GTP 3',8-cyclase MoaA [Bacteroidota bacterium]